MENKLPGVQRDVLLNNYTTYKIGGPAKYFFIANTPEDLIKALKAAKEKNVSVFILGGGSNLLVSDKGFSGLVVKIDISDTKIENSRVYVGPGVQLSSLAYSVSNQGFSGLEWAAGIPGATVGGAVFGNAQAFGSRISDFIERIEAINLKTLRPVNFTKAQCKFSLKNSIFKKNKNLAIVSVVFNLKQGDKEEIKNKIDKFLEYRKNNHPLSFPSAGSTFVNPERKITNKKLLKKFPELIEFNAKGTIPAGYLIQKAGLAGKIIGGAQISEKHANFIINLGGAKAKDVLSLIKLAQQKVKKVFGINLETEVQIVGFKK